jgi:transcriptional regulator ATRX
MKGSGCILAHCMGLGKTLQIIGLIHTLLSNRERTKCNKILILLPKNVLTNWKDEIEKWTEKCKFKIPVYQLKDDGSDLSKEKYKQRLNTIEEWFNDHGVFLLSYHMYKFLVTGKYN